MSGEIGALVLLLIIVFIFGNLWFHFIEGILRGLKKLFAPYRKTKAWHPLPQDKKDFE